MNAALYITLNLRLLQNIKSKATITFFVLNIIMIIKLNTAPICNFFCPEEASRQHWSRDSVFWLTKFASNAKIIVVK